MGTLASFGKGLPAKCVKAMGYINFGKEFMFLKTVGIWHVGM